MLTEDAYRRDRVDDQMGHRPKWAQPNFNCNNYSHPSHRNFGYDHNPLKGTLWMVWWWCWSFVSRIETDISLLFPFRPTWKLFPIWPSTLGVRRHGSRWLMRVASSHCWLACICQTFSWIDWCFRFVWQSQAECAFAGNHNADDTSGAKIEKLLDFW